LIYSPTGSAKAGGELVAALGGKTLEYVFVIDLDFLKGHEKLDAPYYAIAHGEDYGDEPHGHRTWGDDAI